MATKKATKKTAKKTAKKAASKVAKKTTKKATIDKSKKFAFVDSVLDSVLEIAEVTRKNEVKLKKTDLKQALEAVFTEAATRAAGGERVRLPVVGALVRSEVKARKAGKGINPFTGEEIMIKARPASKKPRWSFPKGVKEIFANKKNW